MASAAAVRTDSSLSCKSGTSAGTAMAAAFSIAPKARVADVFTGALESLSIWTSAAIVACGSPRTSPSAVAAWQRTVSSDSFNNAISRGPAAAAAGPIRPSALTAWIRTDVESSARADRSVATASSTGSFFGDCANCFGFRKDGQSLPTLATRPRPRPAHGLRRHGPQAAEDPECFDCTLPHHLAGVPYERGQ